jgi:osmoprotectant transport system ATP-binding protein
MREGRLVQYDTPDTTLAHPVNRFVRDFVGTDRTLKRLGLVRISNLMQPDPPTCTLDSTIEEAKACFEDYGARSIFIVDKDDGTLKGWIDKEEIGKNDSLLDAMYEAHYTDIAVRADATAREALSAMVARGFRITPVVDRRGKLVGTITLQALQDLAAYDPEASAEAKGANA